MEKTLKLGVFGVWRGLAYIKAVRQIEGAKITAICDCDPEKLEAAKKECPEDVQVFAEFDDLLKSGIDAVVLCNYFHQHVPFAIRAMKAGIHVLSETLPAVTLKECVDLVETVEETGCTYALAENYPFSRSCMEMTRIYESGVLGEVTFAEGEYVHPMSVAESKHYTPDPKHWRSNLPKTYYMSHSLAPLMAATSLMPRRVIGKVAAGKAYCRAHGRPDGDGAGIMLVEMDGGALFRISGSCNFGGKGNWYRLGCEKGGVETLRGSWDKVRLCINEWDLTEETRAMGTECVYTPGIDELGKKALDSGHGGGDFWVMWHFVQDLQQNRRPFMDVCRAAAIAATGILGWRSVLSDSEQLDIPDFSRKEDRDRVRDDDLSPFDSAEKPADLPHTYYQGNR